MALCKFEHNNKTINALVGSEIVISMLFYEVKWLFKCSSVVKLPNMKKSSALINDLVTNPTNRLDSS